MRYWIAGLLALAVMASANEPAEVPEGTPAMLEAANGKKIRVFLQSLVDDQLTFLPYKAKQTITIGLDKISSFEFFPDYDAAAAEEAYQAGDYDKMVSLLEPMMADYAEFIVVDSNLQAAYAMLMDAYRGLDRNEKALGFARQLTETGNPELVLRGQVTAVLINIAEGHLEEAVSVKAKVQSEAASLYLDACIKRAQNEPKQAMQTVTTVISEHANAVEWLAPTELLGAHLYLDMGMTNSALNTARQVKNIYNGTPVAAEAAQLQETLSVPDEES